MTLILTIMPRTDLRWRGAIGGALLVGSLACERPSGVGGSSAASGGRVADSGETARTSAEDGYLVAIDTPVRTYLDYVIAPAGERGPPQSSALPQLAQWEGVTRENALRIQRFSPGQALSSSEIVALLPIVAPASRTLDVSDAPYRAPTSPGDATPAIQAALDHAKEIARPGSPVDVLIPPGIYDHSAVLDVGTDVRLRGAGGILRATDPARSAVHLQGDRSGALFLTLTSGASERRSNDESSGIWVGPKAPSRAIVHDTLVIGNEIVQPSSAHVLGYSEEGGLWAFNYAHDGFADAYHHTGASSHCQVVANRANGPGGRGDDLYSFVGYLKNGDPVHHCSCIANWGRNGHARGLAAVGAGFIDFEYNDISHTQWAGIYVAQERNYDTFGSFSIRVVGNRISFANLEGSHSGLLAYADQPFGTRPSNSFGDVPNAIRDLTVSQNVFSNVAAARGGGWGIEVRASCEGGSVSGNTVRGARSPGIVVAGSRYTVASNVSPGEGGSP